MRVTTVRFGEDLWKLLHSESQRAGVSVSQYIREAALARAAFAAGSRAEAPQELLARWTESTLQEKDVPNRGPDAKLLVAALTQILSEDEREASRAVQAQSKQVQRRNRSLTDGRRSD
jgi:hypothetical protein